MRRGRIYAGGKGDAATGSKKQGIAVFLGRNLHVIDVEMVLPANGLVEPGTKKKAPPRIDVVVLEEDGDLLSIVFYEAKLSWNTELRSKKGDPRIIGQLRTYEERIRSGDRQAEVVGAHRRACSLLVELHAMRSPTGPAMHDRIARAVSVATEWRVDPKPRLSCADTPRSNATMPTGPNTRRS